MKLTYAVYNYWKSFSINGLISSSKKKILSLSFSNEVLDVVGFLSLNGSPCVSLSFRVKLSDSLARCSVMQERKT